MFEKKKHKIIINNIVQPIKLKKDEKLIFVVGDEDNMPSQQELEEILHNVKDFKNSGSSMICSGTAIRPYIVLKDTQIELYLGAKLQ